MKKEFTATDVMALFESLRSDFRIIAEQLTIISGRVDAVYEMVGKNSEDIAMISIQLTTIKNDMHHIKANLSGKVDRDEFVALEKRVHFLEQKLRSR